MSIFMNYEGITGESTDKDHRDWMDVDNIRWGVRRNATSHMPDQNDLESANAQTTNLMVTRRMDRATPNLFLESCCGGRKTVVIHLTETAACSRASQWYRSHAFMAYTLRNALISDYEVSAGSQDESRPTETLTISFVDIEVKYTPYDEDGNAMPAIAVGFDTATNTKR